MPEASLRDYPFGEIASQGGSQEDTRYDFTGKERDRGTGLHYFGARYYDPSIGRWLSVDPLAGKYPSCSPYNYVFSNPLRLIDPNGKGPFDFYYQMVKDAHNQFGDYVADKSLKYTPKIFDYGASIAGIISYEVPIFWVISAELKAGAIALKTNSPYYQSPEIIIDIIGGVVSLVDPITGELVEMTLDEAFKRGILTERDIEELEENNNPRIQNQNGSEFKNSEQNNNKGKDSNGEDDQREKDDNDLLDERWERYDPSKY